MNLVVQSEFKQQELGVATSSSQLFRSLGSTMGTAIFGAMLTAGIVASLGDMSNNHYLQSMKATPAASQLGNLDDVNTMLTLNTPDIKQEITDGAHKQFDTLPEPIRDNAEKTFTEDQSEFASKITHAFGNSMQKIFQVASGILLVVTVLVFTIKERTLAKAGEDETPGEV
jgi:predicted PurR-regulated permease PerM